VYCGFSEQSDLNAAKTLELLGVAGVPAKRVVYGLKFTTKL